MNCKTTLALVLGLITAAVAIAQPRPDSTVPLRAELTGVDAARAGQRRAQAAMYEDIEIMSRIIDRAVRRLGARGDADGDVWAVDLSTSTDAFARNNKGDFLLQNAFPRVVGQTHDGVRLWDEKSTLQGEQALLFFLGGKPTGWAGELVDAHGHPVAPKTEGVHLKNHGVVFSVTIPVHFTRPASPTNPSAPKPLSDWDRTRKELRGEKVEAGSIAPTSKEQTLTDILLRVLADNGSHFSQLGDKDQLTIAATLRDVQSCAACHDGAKKSTQVSRALFEAWANKAEPKGNATGKTDSGVSPDSPYQNLIRDNVLLGDLDAKQGQWAKAVAAYQKAAESAAKQLNALQGVTGDSRGGAYRRELLTGAVEVQTKLARAYQMLKDERMWQQALKAGADYAQAASIGSDAADAGKPAPTGLPAKLVISVTKAAVDQVASGKMSFDDFKKAAAIDYDAFGTPTKP